MREIKFRGIRTDNSEFVYGYYVMASAAQLGIYDVPLAELRVCHVIVVGGEFFHVKPETIGQYTGLKDKHGEEIWEGDVIVGYDYAGDVRIAPRPVSFDEEKTAFSFVRSTGAKTPLYKLRERYLKVIGNIYQNPEVLEEK